MQSTEILIELKKIALTTLDSFTAGAVFIATALSLEHLNYIYKIIMIGVGTLLLVRGFVNYQKSKIDKKIKEYDLEIKKKEYEKLLQETEI